MMASNPQPCILVVEDEALLLFVIAEELRDAGYVVFEAGNADQAILLLEAHPEINVLFSDIDMPGSMDGLKLSRAVRDRWPPVRIIIASGKNRPERGMLPDDAIFMPKPYMSDGVVSAIRQVLDQS